LGKGEEGGDDDDWPVSPVSSRLLFFDASVFELFAEDAFILQVTGVFTRILSGAVEVGGLRRRAIYSRNDGGSIVVEGKLT
jgi:hypothetical protein